MCTAIPTKLVKRYGERGIVEKDGLELEVDLSLVPEALTGDYLIIHVGLALSIMDEIEALETINLLSKEWGEQ